MSDSFLESEVGNVLIQVKIVFLFILTLVDILFILLSYFFNFSIAVQTKFTNFDLLVCLLIFIDIIFEYSISDLTLQEYLFDEKNIISLISIMPLDLLFVRFLAITRLVRFFRLFRLIRIWNLKREMKSIEYLIQQHLLRTLAIIGILFMLFSSVLLMSVPIIVLYRINSS